MPLHRMKTRRLEFPSSKQVQWVAGLRRNPGEDLRGSIPDLAQVAIKVPDVANHHAATGGVP